MPPSVVDCTCRCLGILVPQRTLQTCYGSCLSVALHLQIQTDLQRLLASTGSSPAAMSWQAELARCQLVLHKASLADGDTSTPALLLLFEDPAFAKLAPNSAQVKRARSRLQQLMASHSAELAGMDLAVASTDFNVFYGGQDRVKGSSKGCGVGS